MKRLRRVACSWATRRTRSYSCHALRCALKEPRRNELFRDVRGVEAQTGSVRGEAGCSATGGWLQLDHNNPPADGGYQVM